jgi:hypothetical protein
MNLMELGESYRGTTKRRCHGCTSFENFLTQVVLYVYIKVAQVIPSDPVIDTPLAFSSISKSPSKVYQP